MGNFDEKGPRTDRGTRSDSDRRGPRNFDRGFSNPNREMHKATCAECGKECEVPFKPTEGRDVFCKECFQKKRRY
jgi:CxxC-x17-CxxC domain-containing protein